MTSQKQLVLQWIDRQSFPAVVEFREAMLSASIHALGLSPIEAESFAEASLHTFWNYLLEKINHDYMRGISLTFEILESSSYLLKWTPHILTRSPDKKERLRGLKLMARPSLLRLIDGLNEREYEALGCVVSILAGGTHIKLTPRGGEGGVDFFALIEQPGRCHLFSGRSGPLRIIGQTKKYGNPVSPGEMRDFITTITNVQKRHPDVEKHVPTWFRIVRGSVAGWFIAHQGLTGGAERLAHDHGIVISDALDLAEIIALSRKLDIYKPVKDRETKLRDLIENLLTRP